MPQQITNQSSRKKFLWFTGAAIACAGIFRFFNKKEKENPELVKMLTQDGQLVEVDKKLLAATDNKKITKEELQQWIKK
jgi:hypothetical protein